ncbi:MAG: RNA-binding protein [Candidatus Omnitrophica bacterium]|nr:RNA-binding protein [Candidatus Omnitrophota bacterium]MCF7894281.1 RNA-binding protein [Candidatus Omnitrophota bacterium]
MEENKKIYVGNLNYDTTKEDLQKAIEEAGATPTDVTIISDKYTGRSKGFGFAEFETEEDTQKVIEALEGKELAGRNLKVNKARPRKPRNDNFGSGRRF